jgi:hypothetical protein
MITIWPKIEHGNEFNFEINIQLTEGSGEFTEDENGELKFDWYEDAPDNYSYYEDIVTRFYYDYIKANIDPSIIAEVGSYDFDLVTLEDNTNFPMFFPCVIWGSWNGWECIKVTEATARFITDSFDKLGDGSPFRFIWEGARLKVINPYYGGGEDEDDPIEWVEPVSGMYDMSLGLCWQQIN